MDAKLGILTKAIRNGFFLILKSLAIFLRNYFRAFRIRNFVHSILFTYKSGYLV